jgi:activator of HSP90 ATPase
MKTFKKTFEINAEAEDVYAALTNPVTIELWSGYPAVMNAVTGSEFSLWDGDITGRIMEVEENKRIVQEWYFGEQPEISVASIILVRDFGSTFVTVEHTNIPDDDYSNIAEGWREYIMGAIQRFFNPNF